MYNVHIVHCYCCTQKIAAITDDVGDDDDIDGADADHDHNGQELVHGWSRLNIVREADHQR